MDAAPAVAALNALAGAPPQSATAAGAVKTSTSLFLSLYQSLAGFQTANGAGKQQPPNTKAPQTKKNGGDEPGQPAVALNIPGNSAPHLVAPLAIANPSLGLTVDAPAQVPGAAIKQAKGQDAGGGVQPSEAVVGLEIAAAPTSALQQAAVVSIANQDPAPPSHLPNVGLAVQPDRNLDKTVATSYTKAAPSNDPVPSRLSGSTAPATPHFSAAPVAARSSSASTPESTSLADKTQSGLEKAAPIQAPITAPIQHFVAAARPSPDFARATVDAAAAPLKPEVVAVAQPAETTVDATLQLPLAAAPSSAVNRAGAALASVGSITPVPASGQNLAFALDLAPNSVAPHRHSPSPVFVDRAALPFGAALQRPIAATTPPADVADAPLVPETPSQHAHASDRSLGPAASLIPRPEGLAASLHLPTTSSRPAPAQRIVPTTPTRTATAPVAPRGTARPTATPLAAPSPKDPQPPAGPRELIADGRGLTWNAPPAVSHFDARPAPLPQDSTETLRTHPQTLEILQPVAPELPRPHTNGQILLQLGTKDQASAAVRITDRAGSVNISVHAPDESLRNSLRSNLGELTSQLNQQGWKTDVVKAPVAPLPTHSDSRSESGPQGQRSFSQHQPSGEGERQPQRDRRPDNRWLEELEQQTSGDAGTPGGNQ